MPSIFNQAGPQVSNDAVAAVQDAAASADFLSRLLARGIDAVVLVVVQVALGLVMGFGYDWLIVGATVVIVYFALCHHLAGATIGKRALGLQVVGPDGERPSLRAAVLREAFTLLGAIPFLGPLLALGAWIWMGLRIQASQLKQGPHDLLAGGTRVTRKTGTLGLDSTP
jgi:uncharacterized RDD family membrane protein YckC